MSTSPSKSGNDVHFLVEAKAIGVELKDLHVRQAIDYGANQGIEWPSSQAVPFGESIRSSFKKPIVHVLLRRSICWR